MITKELPRAKVENLEFVGGGREADIARYTDTSVIKIFISDTPKEVLINKKKKLSILEQYNKKISLAPISLITEEADFYAYEMRYVDTGLESDEELVLENIGQSVNYLSKCSSVLKEIEEINNEIVILDHQKDNYLVDRFGKVHAGDLDNAKVEGYEVDKIRYVLHWYQQQVRPETDINTSKFLFTLFNLHLLTGDTIFYGPRITDNFGNLKKSIEYLDVAKSVTDYFLDNLLSAENKDWCDVSVIAKYLPKKEKKLKYKWQNR